MKYYFGIDLGTTNCCAYRIQDDDGKLELAPLKFPQLKFDTQGNINHIHDCILPSFTLFFRESGNKTPLWDAVKNSIPFWAQEDNPIVGCMPRDYYFFEEKYFLDARQLIRSVKSRLHLAKDEPWEFKGKHYSPTDISSLYLKYILQAIISQDAIMQRYIYENTIVTVPASFADMAREKTRKAVTDSGIILGKGSRLLLDEPTAAYYCFLYDNKDKIKKELQEKDETVLVYDLGGGTLDMSLLSTSLKDGVVVVEVIDKSDHILLGGDDFDMRLANHYLDTIEIDLSRKSKELLDDFNEVKKEDWFYQPIVAHARDAKEVIFGKNSADITTLCSKLSFNAEYRMPSLKISKNDYRNITSAFLLDNWQDALKDSDSGEGFLFLRTGYSDIVNPLINLLKSNKFPKIDKLIFSGGMTIIPFVIERIKEVVNRLCNCTCQAHALPEPFHAVARGAAFFLWAKENEEALFINKLTHTYSLKVKKTNREVCLYVVADKGCEVPHSGTIEQDFTFCPSMGNLVMELWDGKTTGIDEKTMKVEEDNISPVGKKKILLSGFTEDTKIPRSTNIVVRLSYEIDEDEILRLWLTLSNEDTRDELSKKGITGQVQDEVIRRINSILNESKFQSEKA